MALRISIKELAALIVHLKKTIDDDFRADEFDESDKPSMCVTIGTNDRMTDYGYQTGDNSFTGGAYGFPHWAVVAIDRRSNSREIAKDIIAQWYDLIPE